MRTPLVSGPRRWPTPRSSPRSSRARRTSPLAGSSRTALAALLLCALIAGPTLASPRPAGEPPTPRVAVEAGAVGCADADHVGPVPRCGEGRADPGPRWRHSGELPSVRAEPVAQQRPRAIDVQPNRTTVPRIGPSAAGDLQRNDRGRLSGTASYYCTPARPICHHSYPVGSMVAAACGKLRRAIGPDWRGRRVTVRSGSRSIRVTLVDWCGSTSKTIDLYGAPFSRLAPLSAGVVEVTVSW